MPLVWRGLVSALMLTLAAWCADCTKPGLILRIEVQVAIRLHPNIASFTLNGTRRTKNLPRSIRQFKYGGAAYPRYGPLCEPLHSVLQKVIRYITT
jgi:hypothetical protein